jgi:hypothetical protein
MAGPVADIVPKARLRHDDMGSVTTSVIARSIGMRPRLLADEIDEVVKTYRGFTTTRADEATGRASESTVMASASTWRAPGAPIDRAALLGSVASSGASCWKHAFATHEQSEDVTCWKHVLQHESLAHCPTAGRDTFSRAAK